MVVRKRSDLFSFHANDYIAALDSRSHRRRIHYDSRHICTDRHMFFQMDFVRYIRPGNAHMGDFLTIRQLAHRCQQIGNPICAEHIGALCFPGVHDAEYLSGKID